MIRWVFELTLCRLIGSYLRRHLLFRKVVFGDPTRVTIASSALVNNALFNVMSGRIVVEDDAFFGHNVCLLTGTHDIAAPKHLRKFAIPPEGRDIVIGAGTWVASNVTILGPAVVGEMAVIAAGSVVTGDVPPYTVVAGVPASVIGHVPRRPGNMVLTRSEAFAGAAR